MDFLRNTSSGGGVFPVTGRLCIPSFQPPPYLLIAIYIESLINTHEEHANSAADEESEDADSDNSGLSSSAELDIDDVGNVELNIDQVDINGL